MSAGKEIVLKAGDGHVLGAYSSQPPAGAKSALVVLPEIFGVNVHMRRVADAFARMGFNVLAPAMFDRVAGGLTLDYSQASRGLECVAALSEPELLTDLQAAIDAVGQGGEVSVVGFCWGGALAYLAASRCDRVKRAVCFYGTRIVQYCERMKPRVPVMYHFGALDASLPPAAIEKIRAADPQGIFHLYAGADHAFTNDDRPQFNADAARLAYLRSSDFLDGD